MIRLPEISCGYEEAGAKFEGEDEEPLRSAVAGLLELGFTRLGVKWEATNLEPGRRRMLNLAGPKQQCFVGWHRDEQGALLFHALTVFEGGGYIISWSGGPFTPLETERARCNVLPGAGPGQVLARHANGLERMKRAGHQVREKWAAEDHLEALQAFYAHPDNPVRASIETIRFRRIALLADGVIILAFCAAFALLWFPNKTAGALVASTAICAVLVQWAAAVRAKLRSPGVRVSLLEPLGMTMMVGLVLTSLDLF